MSSQPLVGEVGEGFSGGREVWRGFGPAHWKNKRQGKELFTGELVRNGNCQLRDVRRVEGNPVETIGDVHFDEVDGAKGGIRFHNAAEKTLKAPAILHTFLISQLEGVSVDAGKRIVHDDAGTAVPLGYHPHRTDPKELDKVGILLDDRHGKDNPLATAHKVDEFLLEKITEFDGGLVRATVKGLMKAGGVPRGSGDGHLSAKLAKVAEVGPGRMAKAAHIGMKVGGTMFGCHETAPPNLLEQGNILLNQLT